MPASSSSPHRGGRAAALIAASLGFALPPGAVVAHGDAAGERLRVQLQSHASYSFERCVEARAGQWLQLRFDTPQAVDFNIHHHAQSGTEYPLKQRVSGILDERVMLAADGEYCFQWINPNNLDAAFAFDFSYQLLAR